MKRRSIQLNVTVLNGLTDQQGCRNDNPFLTVARPRDFLVYGERCIDVKSIAIILFSIINSCINASLEANSLLINADRHLVGMGYWGEPHGD